MKTIPTAMGALAALCFACAHAPAAPKAAAPPVEQWGVFETSLRGPKEGNPFAEVELHADFSSGDRKVRVRGFYDGDGVYRIRFMPDRPGAWKWTTVSNRPALDKRGGAFQVTAPKAGNRGPVRVKDKYHFAYADGSLYYPFGTTIYAMVHQDMALQERTLATLKKAPFNKLRLCLFPKWYDYNRVEPPYYPFERSADGKFDLARPHPPFWQLLDKRVQQLGAMGIEADLILFHPYDTGHWGFDRMPPEVNAAVLRYAIARLAAHRNIWWSMANEWDFVKNRTVEEWNALFDVIAAEDPYKRLASIHNGVKFFDHKHPAITHASIQSPDVGKMREWREQYGKPAVNDEAMYEGNIDHAWGNISAKEMVHRHWVGFLRGGYVGHGETYLAPDDVLWWARGGELRGQSPSRLAFMRKVIENGAPLDPVQDRWPFGPSIPAARQGDQFYIYFGAHQPGLLKGKLLAKMVQDDKRFEKARWSFEVIDPWEMTITPVPGEFEGDFAVKLPAKPYLAVRARAVAQ